MPFGPFVAFLVLVCVVPVSGFRFGRIQTKGVRADDDLDVVRASLVPTLDRRVAKEDTFTKPAPATYGLVEWRQKDTAPGSLLSALD